MDPNRTPETPWVREWREELEARGEARGEARSLLRVLEGRGIAVDEDARARIEAETDVAVLDRWLDRAITATSIEEVFSDH